MKTSFLSLILIAVFLSLSTTSFTMSVEQTNSIKQLKTRDNDFVEASLFSYATRINHFRDTSKGFDYFDSNHHNLVS